MKQQFIFLSFRDFSKDGGGSIRIYSVLNNLAEKGHDICFISNVKDISRFHNSINHISLDYEVSKRHKQIIQLLTPYLPYKLLRLIYKNLFKKIKLVIDDNGFKSHKIIFFEYLDNTIGYLLKKNHIINYYINDIHGIVPIEFNMFQNSNAGVIQKSIYRLKEIAAVKLDGKVLCHADGLIYVSNAMKEHFISKYKSLKNMSDVVLPNLLSVTQCYNNVDKVLLNKLREDYKITVNDFVFFFAGGFKVTSGLLNSLNALKKVKEKNKGQHFKYILIGSGVLENEVSSLINELNLENNVIKIKKIPYDKLFTYQQLAHVILNSDTDNPYSQMIVHLKYFDALASGRLVINGGFESVKELNKYRALSLLYNPKNIEDYYKQVEISYSNYKKLLDQFKETKEYVCENLTYSSKINMLEKFSSH